MSERIQCGGLMERSDLCLIEVLGFDWRPGQACGILGKFAEVGIPLSYLSIGHGASGDKNMSFCVNLDDMTRGRELLDEIRDDFHPEKVGTHEPTLILTLYGPHFLEKHSLATMVFSALCVDGIDAHTVCSSVNSISVVINTRDRDVTVRCLEQRFDWPK
jgi:aspartokinase